MNIKKQVRQGFFLSAIVGMSLLIGIVFTALLITRDKVSLELEETQSTLDTQLAEEMTTVTMELAQSIAAWNAEKINSQFIYVQGELDSLKKNIERLYENQMTTSFLGEINLNAEYMVAPNANIDERELEQTLEVYAGVVKLFDSIREVDPLIDKAYLTLETGISFANTHGFYEQLSRLDLRERDWYQRAKTTGETAWSKLYWEMETERFITVSVPLVHENELFGVLAFDLDVELLGQAVLSQGNEVILASYIFDGDSSLLFSTDGSEKYGEIWQDAESIFATIPERSGAFQIGETTLGFARIAQTDWLMVATIDQSLILTPVAAVSDTVTERVEVLQESLLLQNKNTILFLVLTAFCIAIYQLLHGEKFSEKITKPIRTLEEITKEIGNGHLDLEIPDFGSGEIGNLARQFQTMTGELQLHIENVAKITAEKERVSAELAVANRIQSSMLPVEFPDRNEFKLYATMTPAKEVGGDFYDFFSVDEDHLALVIADVSGKGIPAALFMVISKTLLKNMTQTKKSPKEILEITNNLLCEGNDEGMFVTVWLGIYEISTGKLTAANAGHEYPIVKEYGGDFSIVKDTHGFILAGMEDMKYKEYELQLNSGDTLFLYTDGVAEATDEKKELFGTERLLSSLNRKKDAEIRSLLEGVKDDIDIFVGNAPQFDDITMLGFQRTEIADSEGNRSV
ncbi:MAG: SpoIIE family protein phosphatase [Bacillota bacterium]